MTKSEAQTRSALIDQQLAQSGWNVKDPTQVVEEIDILTALPPRVTEPRTPYEGHQFSDYVLLGKDRKPLAVIEAKKPVAMPPLAASRQSSTATTSRSSWAENCRSASTPTATSSILGSGKRAATQGGRFSNARRSGTLRLHPPQPKQGTPQRIAARFFVGWLSRCWAGASASWVSV